MVYKRYIKRNGRVCGPYYYESYRDKNGKVVSRYLRDYEPPKNYLNYLVFSALFLIVILLLFLMGNIMHEGVPTGRAISEIEADSESIAIAGQIANNEINSSVNLIADVDVEILEKPSEKNKILKFDVPEGVIELSFDLLNYSGWAVNSEEAFAESSINEINAENFEVSVDTNPERYKWGYKVRLTELNFMSKIDINTDIDIIIVDNKTLKIGSNYLSFADLAQQGYILNLESPVLVGNLSSSVIAEENDSFLNNSELVSNNNETELNNSREEEINFTEDIEESVEEINQSTVNSNQSTVNSSITNQSEINLSIEEEVVSDTNSSEEESSGDLSSNESSDDLPGSETEEDSEEAEEENSTAEIGMITGNAVRAVSGFFVNGFSGITGRSVSDYKNSVTIYVQRNFANSSYQLGDLIDLDPLLIRVEGGSAVLGSDVYRCGTINDSGIYAINQTITNNTLTGVCINITASDVILDCVNYIVESTNSYPGIYTNGSNITIKNCNISMGSQSGGYGVQLMGSNNSFIYDSVLDNQYYGVYLYNVTNLTVRNLSTSLNNEIGVFVNYSSNSLFYNVTSNNNDEGIYLFSGRDNNITDCKVNYNSDYGVQINSGTNNSIGYSNITGNSVFESMPVPGQSIGYGVYVYSGYNNSIKNNFVNLNAYYGIIMLSTSGNSIENNSANSNECGIYIGTSSNNSIVGNNVWNCSSNSQYTCFYVYHSDNNTFNRDYINYTNNYGIRIYSTGEGFHSSGNVFKNINISNSQDNPIYIQAVDDALNNYNNFTNISITLSYAHGVQSVGANSYTRFENFVVSESSLAGFNLSNSNSSVLLNNSFGSVSLDYYIEDSDIGEYNLSGNSLEIANSNGNIKFLNQTLSVSGSNLSNSLKITSNNIFVNVTENIGFNQSANISLKGLALTNPGVIVDSNDDGSFQNCTFCNIFGYSGGVLEFNTSHFTSYRAVSFDNLYNCQDLTQQNTVYTLQGNLTTTGTCFSITANNITLDFNGHNITGDYDTGGSDYGVYINGYNSTTVKNGYIYGFYRGAAVVNSKNNNLTNMSLALNHYGVEISSGFNDSIEMVWVNSSTDDGLRIISSSFSRVTNITLNASSDSSSDGLIYVSNSNHTIIQNSSAITNQNYVVGVYGISVNNSFRNLTLVGGAVSGFRIYANSSSFANNSFSGSPLNYYFYKAGAESYQFNSNYFKMENGDGSLVFLTAITGSGLNLSEDINLINNKVFVNSSRNTGFNVSANITLVVPWFFDPALAADYNDDGVFENCSSEVCSIINYSGGSLYFNVTHFTSYRAEEGSGLVICGELNETNKIYTLGGNLTTAGTCFNITANNVTIDFNGYNITGDYDTGGSDYGVYINGYNSTTVKNGYIYGFYRGAAVVNSKNNNLTNLSVLRNYLEGVYILNSSYNNLSNDRINSNSYGVYLLSGSENTLENLTVWNCSLGCISFSDSNNNSVFSGIVNLSFSELVSLSDSDNNSFVLLTVLNASNTGIELTGSVQNRFENLSLSDMQVGFNITLSNRTSVINNSFADIVMDYYVNESSLERYSLNGSSFEIESDYGKIKFLNTSLFVSGTNLSKVISISANRVFVNTTLDGGFNTTANISIKSLSLTSPKPLVSYDDSYWENCSICNNLSYSDGVFLFNTTHFTTYKAVEFNGTHSCMVLSSENSIYYLAENISFSGNCFNISANNITLDLDGHKITGTDSGDGIYITSNNSSVRNGYIYDFAKGINLVGSYNVNLSNLVITSNSYGVLFNSSSNNSFIDGVITSSSSSDVHLADSMNTSLLNISYSTRFVDADSELIRKWHYQAYVESVLGYKFANVNITGFNGSGDFAFNLTTNSSGRSAIYAIIDYIDRGGVITYYSNYSIHARNMSFSISNHSYNSTFYENNLTDVFILDNANPVVTIIPITISGSTSIDYSYNVTDHSKIRNCSLVLDGEIVASDSEVNHTGGSEVISYVTTVGPHTYSINCTDSALNMGNTSSNEIVVYVSENVSTTSVTSGGGGGGSRTISLKIETPIVVVAYDLGEVEIPISLYNDGEVNLNKVNLSSHVLKDSMMTNIKTRFDNDYFSSINQGVRKNVTLFVTLTSRDVTVYDVIINASSYDPRYKTSNHVSLNFMEKNASGVKRMIIFANDMIAENPECLELKEMIEEAEELFNKGDLNGAMSLSNRVIDSCKKSISGPKNVNYPFKGKESLPLYLAVTIAASIILGIVFNIYRRWKFKNKRKI